MQHCWSGIGIVVYDQAVEIFTDRVKTMSAGRLEVTNYNAEVLLGIGEIFTGVGEGVCDLSITASVYWKGLIPLCYYVWVVPFTLDRMEFAEMIYQQMGLKELLNEAYGEFNVMSLGWGVNDEYGGLVSTVPLHKYSDLKGLKLRAFGLWADWMVENGGSIVIVPGGEIYMALSTGVLDAASFCAPAGWAGMKIYEVADYYLDPPCCPYDTCEMIMNVDSFNKLPDDLKEILIAASRLQMADMSRLTIEQDANAREELKDAGMEFIRWSDEDLIAARDWMWGKFYESAETDEYCARYVEMMKKSMKIYDSYFGSKRVPW